MKIKSNLGRKRNNTGFKCHECDGRGDYITCNKKYASNKFIICPACSGSGCWRPTVPGVFYADGHQVRMGDICDLHNEWVLISYSPDRAEFVAFRDDTFYALSDDMTDVITFLIPLGNIYSTEIPGDNRECGGDIFNFCETDDFKRFQEEFQAKIKLWEE